MSNERSGGRLVRARVWEWGLALAFATIWLPLSHALGLTAGQWILGALLGGAACGLVTAIFRSRRRCDRG